MGVGVVRQWHLLAPCADGADTAHHPLGQGCFNRHAARARRLHRLRAQGRDPNAILELWPPPEATVAESVAKEAGWAAESIRYLRRFIPE